jgi:hypothetical protein
MRLSDTIAEIIDMDGAAIYMIMKMAKEIRNDIDPFSKEGFSLTSERIFLKREE